MSKFLMNVVGNDASVSIPFEANEFAVMITMFQEMAKDEQSFPKISCCVGTTDGEWFCFADSDRMKAVGRAQNLAANLGLQPGIIKTQ